MIPVAEIDKLSQPDLEEYVEAICEQLGVHLYPWQVQIMATFFRTAPRVDTVEGLPNA